MPRLKPATQAARREHILDAAERCFARAGFHRTTMQDICKEAGISAGALYVYFASKEDLIAGISERDRMTLGGQLAEIGTAGDLMEALRGLAMHYCHVLPRQKNIICIEIGAESTRNPAVAGICRAFEHSMLDALEQVLTAATQDGKIAPSIDARAAAQMMMLLGDGLFWRRAIDPDFDADTSVQMVVDIVTRFLNPVTAAKSADSVAAAAKRSPKKPSTSKAGSRANGATQ